MRRSTTLLACLLSMLGAISCRMGADESIIRHRRFEDFRKGSFSDGGANVYVSRQGTIQLIPRWDLNGDGQLDLLVNQDHNAIETVDAFIYWGSQKGYQSLFPAFWKETMPAYKLVQAIEKRHKHVAFLPTFGGGPVKLIDLNDDQFLEIVFVNTIHNYSVHMDAYVYWGGPDGYSKERMTKLPTLFARDFAVADFNRDGHLDLVFANFGNETGDRWGYKNHRESFIYWGGPEGFSTERRSSVSTLSAVSCAAGDFNGDQWPDLAFANNNLRQKSVVVYLGGKEGFGPEQRLQIEGGDPGIVRAGDTNRDGADDLLVSSTKTGTSIYLGSADFSVATGSARLPTEHAKDAVMADFNNDGHVDIAFASNATGDSDHHAGDHHTGEAHSEVYWGSAQGFDPQRKVLLPTFSPRALATADLNSDGFAELLFANSHDGESHDVPSYIYWGSAEGYDASHRTHLQGFGAVGVAAADLDRNKIPDVVLMNQSSGVYDHGVPSVVFWGNKAHFYSEADATLLSADGPYYSKIADLNDDGHPDVIFSGEPPCIHWGSADGFKKRESLDLGMRTVGVVVGDFNRDGFLDIVFSTFSGDPRQPNLGIILWGSVNGFAAERSKKIATQAERSCCGISSADLNQDGYLDLIVPNGETMNGRSEILFGGPNGFNAIPSTLLQTNGVGAPAIADLDGNGWLDLVFPGMHDLETQNPHTKSFIFWGNEKGFNDNHRTELEAFSAGEIIVADLNRDGHLDLVSSNYKGAETRSLPIFIFWGNSKHEYSNQQRTELPAESSCGIQVLDLNHDRFLDIIVHNHIKDGDHTFGSYIYWGDKRGYSIERRTKLPTVGPHYSVGINPGNIYDRSDSCRFLSSTLAVPAGNRQLTLEWQGETPHKTVIRFQVRAAASQKSLQKSKWVPITPQQSFSLPQDAKYLQYAAELVSPNGGSSPLLREVVLSFE